MQSSGESSGQTVSWSKARELLTQQAQTDEWKRVRSWASRTQAIKALNAFGGELLALIQKSAPICKDDSGICRFRSLRLGVEPGVFESQAERLYFGDLYTVADVSATGGWIKVTSRSGLTGWIENQNHLPVSRGEFKILSSFKRATTLNFLVNILGMAGFAKQQASK